MKWRDLSRARLREAGVLLRAYEWSGAYYLSGYAVECGLKACIARQIKGGVIPDKRFINDAYTHNLQQLVRLAGLEPNLDAEMKRDSSLELNWTLAKDWNEQSRYELHSELSARDLYDAVQHRQHGVMRWVRKCW